MCMLHSPLQRSYLKVDAAYPSAHSPVQCLPTDFHFTGGGLDKIHTYSCLCLRAKCKV